MPDAPRSTGTDWSASARLLRAELAGDERTWRRLCRLDRQPEVELAVISAAFAMVLQRWFQKVADRREITRLVARYNSVAPSSYRLPPREAEAVLRSGLGEEHLAELVDKVTTVRVVYSFLFMLVNELALAEADIDGLVATADGLSRWVVESTVMVGREPPVDLAAIFGADKMAWRPGRHDRAATPTEPAAGEPA